MPQKALLKKGDKVDRVSRFRDNISEDIPQAVKNKKKKHLCLKNFGKMCASNSKIHRFLQLSS